MEIDYKKIGMIWYASDLPLSGEVVMLSREKNTVKIVNDKSSRR